MMQGIPNRPLVIQNVVALLADEFSLIVYSKLTIPGGDNLTLWCAQFEETFPFDSKIRFNTGVLDASG